MALFGFWCIFETMLVNAIQSKVTFPNLFAPYLHKQPKSYNYAYDGEHYGNINDISKSESSSKVDGENKLKAIDDEIENDTHSTKQMGNYDKTPKSRIDKELNGENEMESNNGSAENDEVESHTSANYDASKRGMDYEEHGGDQSKIDIEVNKPGGSDTNILNKQGEIEGLRDAHIEVEGNISDAGNIIITDNDHKLSHNLNINQYK